MKPYRVYLGACSEYSAEKISALISDAYQKGVFSKRPFGKIVIKPNLVMAHPKVATESFTRKQVIEGILKFLSNKERDIEKIDICEKSGLGVTTSTMFRNAGYYQLKKRYPVKCCAMEERRKTKLVLKKGVIHSHLNVAREMAERDFLIFAPKIKSNVLSQAISAALKLNIGTIDGLERMHHHHRDLAVKIVDILEIADPDLIVSDGVRMSYGGNQMTQHGTDLGVIVIAQNAVAHDMVCAHLLGLDPFAVDHIREAMDRGYGPTAFDQIEISGDYKPETGRAITAGLNLGYIPVESFKSNLKIHSGTPCCIGGCQGIFLDWLYMLKDRKPHLLQKLPHLLVCIGKVEQRVSNKKILLVGECACASNIDNYKSVVRIRGCPPSHKRIVWDMLVNFLVFNPLVRPSLIFDGFVLYPLKKIKGWLINLRFKPLLNKRTDMQYKTG